MLKDAHSGKLTRANIHEGGVTKFRKAVGQDTFDAIASWIFDRFGDSETGWVNTSWTAPKTWEGTPLDAIWQYFAPIKDDRERHEQSALLYGCVFYAVLFEAPGTYVFHRPEGHHKDDPRPFGLTYRLE